MTAYFLLSLSILSAAANNLLLHKFGNRGLDGLSGALLFNADGTPTARTAKILNGTPTHRFVDSEELLGATFFLCDDRAASAITGVVLPVDAGFAAYSGV